MIKMNDKILDVIPQTTDSPIPDEIFREIILLGPLVGHEKFLAEVSTFLPVGTLGALSGLILHPLYKFPGTLFLSYLTY